VVLYSGRSPEELAVDAKDSGADGFISKRTTDRALVLAVQGYLNGPRVHPPANADVSRK